MTDIYGGELAIAIAETLLEARVDSETTSGAFGTSVARFHSGG